MHAIAVDRTGPKAFILAPDGEFSAFEPEHDQIWTMDLEPPDASPFHLHTTYHLRVNSMRVFSNLLMGHRRLIKPDDFSLPPTVTAYAPSAIEIEYAFNHQVAVRFTGFIPEPDLLVGSLCIKNTFSQPIALIVEMAAILIPLGQGNPIHPDTIDHNHVLSGKTEELFPILFTSGGPTGTSNPYPALHVPVTLAPNEVENIQWVLASKTSQTSSFEAARNWTAQDWHKDLQAYKKSHQKKMVFIKTGQPDWDTAFYLAQINARSHLVNFHQTTPCTAFSRKRLTNPLKAAPGIKKERPDLTLLEALHLSQVLLPSHIDYLLKLAEGFIACIDDQGCLCSHNRRDITTTAINDSPLLANLCLMLYEICPDAAFLKQAFPHLRRFFDIGWLKNKKPEPANLPTWDTPEQLQLDFGLFNFEVWEEAGSGLDIRTALSPALAAMLLREASAMKQIAHILGERSARSWYAQWIKIIQEALNSLWVDANHHFSYQDYQTHHTPQREIYDFGQIQSPLKIDKPFSQPQRLQISFKTREKYPKKTSVRLEGVDSHGEMITELIQPPALHWINQRAHITTQKIFSALNVVYFEGFNPDDHFLIKTADYSQPDISCLLPVWSGGIRKEHLASISKSLIDGETLSCAFGIPESWHFNHPLPDGLSMPVNVQWNTLVLDGLAREGYAEEAMTLFTNLMTPIIRGLKAFNGFYPRFDNLTGLPIGAANTIAGLVPVGLFLKIAGIKLMSPERVAVWGENPFPWPVEVRWQGLCLRKETSQVDIIFPDGTQYHGRVTKPRVIKSEKR